jgi:hypothetical protein
LRRAASAGDESEGDERRSHVPSRVPRASSAVTNSS